MSEIYLTNYTPKTELTGENQRTLEMRSFRKGEITLQVEGKSGDRLALRGKYPNDAFWFYTTIDEVETV